MTHGKSMYTSLLRASLAATALAAALSGCASDPGAAPAAAGAAAPLIATPNASFGNWRDLGLFLAPWMAGDAPVPAAGPTTPTRVAGLQREDGRWLAIIVVQTAPPGSAPCPASTGLHVTQGSADGCLRMRRDADFDRWLEQQHSVLYRWLDERGFGARPRAWISYRAPAGGVEAHALLDPTLIEPTTRNNSDFLAGGQPGLDWARRFAAATTAASGGTLAVPAFPFAARIAAADEAQPAASAPAAPRTGPQAQRPAAPASAPAAATPAPAPTPRSAPPPPPPPRPAAPAPAPAAPTPAPAPRPAPPPPPPPRPATPASAPAVPAPTPAPVTPARPAAAPASAPAAPAALPISTPVPAAAPAPRGGGQQQ